MVINPSFKKILRSHVACCNIFCSTIYKDIRQMEDILCTLLFLSFLSALCPLLLNIHIIQSAATAALYFIHF